MIGVAGSESERGRGELAHEEMPSNFLRLRAWSSLASGWRSGFASSSEELSGSLLVGAPFVVVVVAEDWRFCRVVVAVWAAGRTEGDCPCPTWLPGDDMLRMVDSIGVFVVGDSSDNPRCPLVREWRFPSDGSPLRTLGSAGACDVSPGSWRGESLFFLLQSSNALSCLSCFTMAI
jgi:hypothetical protein